MGDPATYRPREEVERWMARDPLAIARERLLAEGVAADRLDALDAATQARIDTATQRALAASYPDPAHDAGREFA